MVTYTRGALHTGSIRPLKVPRPITVGEICAGDDGPRTLVLGIRLRVVSIDDHWMIYTRWWRDTPVNREYFDCLLETGRRVIIFRDHNTGNWFKQFA